jgi:ligand-binding sensor protein
LRRNFSAAPRFRTETTSLVPVKRFASKDKNPVAAPNGNGNGNHALIEALISSKIYQEYERAFGDMTRLPVSLQPVETWQLPHHGRRNENPFCALMAQKSRACAACLQVRERLCENASTEPCTIICSSGLCETVVPVRLSDRLIGFLQTGQVFHKKPGRA